MKELLLHLFRWSGAASLLLLFVTFGALCLWAGLVVGTEFVQKGASFINVPWLPDELRSNADEIVSVMPLAAAALAAMHGNLPTLLAGFSKSIVMFLHECLKLAASEHFGRAGLLPSFLAPSPHLVAVGILFGSYGAPVEPSRPPLVYVAPDSMLSVLPIHPLVHFENAAVDGERVLTERGITLPDARRAMLKADLKALRPCAAPDRPVTIRPYGFASDDRFAIPGVNRDESDRLNVAVANRRARAVYDALNRLIEENELSIAVDEPFEWETFEKMREARNSMIRVPEGSDRDPFSDRVAVLHLMSLGACGAVDPPASSTTATELPAQPDATPPLDGPTTSRSNPPVKNGRL